MGSFSGHTRIDLQYTSLAIGIMSAILKPRLGVRPMTEDDLDQVMGIESQTYVFPWTRGIFRDCLHVGYCCWVYESGDDVEAYSVMSVGAGEAHILTIVVKESCRGQGLGKLMLELLLEIAQGHRVDTVLLEVRPSNKIAVSLYRNMGFNEVGLRPNYYPAVDGREDALIMALPISNNEFDIFR